MSRLAKGACAAVLFALASVAPLAGQTLDVVVSGGVSYTVVDFEADTVISTHATYHVALESAANFALSTGDRAVIEHHSETRVRAVGTPPPGADTVFVPTPADTVFVQADTVVIRITFDAGG